MLRTPSGKVELSPPSLLQDLKRAEADLQSAKPELVIIGRRDVRSNNSWMHNLPVLAKGPFRCTLLVSSQDASKHGVTDGSTVTLNNITQNENEQRSIQAVVQISEDMMPGVVSLPHGWGHDLPNSKLSVAAERPGANLNALLDMKLRDPLSGNSVLGGVPVTMSLA
ncbi:MAG: molybdopterin dinucleotide binding domain-containing protein [Burkholderiaceae bacterium]